MITNFINATVSDQLMLRLVTYLQRITSALPFMISLKPEERVKLQSVSDGRLPYVLKCLEYCMAHRAKIGMSAEDLAELEATARLFEQLSELLHLVDDLKVGLRDTQMQVGANYYRLSRGVHGQMKLAYDKGRPGMENMLGDMDKLFESQGRSRVTTTQNADMEDTGTPLDAQREKNVA
jgi:hypothetical protein